jgi:hypothetical protein
MPKNANNRYLDKFLWLLLETIKIDLKNDRLVY